VLLACTCAAALASAVLLGIGARPHEEYHHHLYHASIPSHGNIIGACPKHSMIDLGAPKDLVVL
jgi:hypothetical protein